ncbi:hypothetical protein GCM10010441_60060 [Kitasatospora paracochleata]|uniref:PH (Pleckstrin Homology) domain-containing protein n=1 Tax=Kitasatospora paracochleata TaxID=58354 RepID=A0ABT1IV88_9ACTN|nr:hypothetical protein [Kitasatospora paracochleata]MCP2309053.1 hypothetical protein [Kitasatospora paracochleata]
MPGTPTPATTVRLAFLWRAAGLPIGSVLGLLTVVLLTGTGVVTGVVPGLLALAATVAAAVLAVPHGYLLRADEHGVTLWRAGLPRRYPWSAVRGLAMVFWEDSDDRPLLSLRLRTRTPRRPSGDGARWCGPALGTLVTAPGGRPRGGEPRALADLFALLAAHGIPLEEPAYAEQVLRAHGLDDARPGTV